MCEFKLWYCHRSFGAAWVVSPRLTLWRVGSSQRSSVVFKLKKKEYPLPRQSRFFSFSHHWLWDLFLFVYLGTLGLVSSADSCTSMCICWIYVSMSFIYKGTRINSLHWGIKFEPSSALPALQQCNMLYLFFRIGDGEIFNLLGNVIAWKYL